MQPLMSRRGAGVLLHPVSLPGPRSFGEIGREAHNFIDFLAAAGFSVWQLLPLAPTGADRSPYQSTSAFAGNPELIDLDVLADSGWLQPEDIYV
ncbi:MAG: 4-alpha-glucanotransferase, partial [Pseudomonadales bacterium]